MAVLCLGGTERPDEMLSGTFQNLGTTSERTFLSLIFDGMIPGTIEEKL